MLGPSLPEHIQALAIFLPMTKTSFPPLRNHTLIILYFYSPFPHPSLVQALSQRWFSSSPLLALLWCCLCPCSVFCSRSEERNKLLLAFFFNFSPSASSSPLHFLLLYPVRPSQSIKSIPPAVCRLRDSSLVCETRLWLENDKDYTSSLHLSSYRAPPDDAASPPTQEGVIL